MRLVLVIALLVGCRDRDPPEKAVVRVDASRPAVPDVITGAIVVDGASITPTACRVGRDTTLFVEALTPSGTLRFTNAQLYWRSSVLACKKLDRSWGGGSRLDGTHYWRGLLDFECGTITGKLELDCGGITADERAKLDKNRAKAQQENQEP